MVTMRPWIPASLFVIFGVIAEAICAGKDPVGAMKRLRQPPWALPMAAWYVVGICYYAMCFAVVYRLEASGEATRTRLVLIAGLMLANAAWNLIFFRLRAFRWSFWFYLPYGLLVAILIGVLWSVDKLSASLLLVYSAYLPYALAWSYVVLKLNP
ncbi:MAG: tryptophan-rich sensory protein [Candidatus Sulfotelmatobacter sp.]